MSVAWRATAGLANSGGAETGIDFSVLGINLSASDTLSAVLRAKEPRKTWGFLCDLLAPLQIDMTERSAKHRISGSRCYSADELRALLQTEDGIDFLVALMGDAQPRWWRWMQKVMTLAAVRRRQAEDQQEILRLETSPDVEVGARRRIKGALNADRNLSAAIARAETAVGFQRPERARVADPAPRAQTSLPHRAVAAAGGRKGR